MFNTTLLPLPKQHEVHQLIFCTKSRNPSTGHSLPPLPQSFVASSRKHVLRPQTRMRQP